MTEFASYGCFKWRIFMLRGLRWGLIMGSIAILQACAIYPHRGMTMRGELLQGRPQLALAIAEKTDLTQKKVIDSLNKGMLQRINHQYKASNRIFEVAKKEMQALYGISITENLEAITINETLRGYAGDHYEKLLLHAFMAMNYIQLKDRDAARVEMLQAEVEMQAWDDKSTNDAFVRYFAGMIYESLGENYDALISYRKAYKLYKGETYTGHLPIPLTLKKNLLRQTKKLGLLNEYRRYKKTFGLHHYKIPGASKKFGDLIIILNNGLAPVRSEADISIYAAKVQKNLRIAFPVYRAPKQTLKYAKISVDTGIAKARNDKPKRFRLETVENIDALARHALAQAMPGIMARAITRAVIKYNSQHSAENKSPVAGFLMTVANLITERADTRSWSTLPEAIQLQRIRLPVGEHTLHINMIDSAGYTVDSQSQMVNIKSQQLTFLIKRWIAPVVSITKNKKSPIKSAAKTASLFSSIK